MNIAHSIPASVTSVSFSFLTTEDVRRISVKQIVNPVLLDDLNRPNVGGLYDPALGPSDRQDICATCRLTYFTCPGHFGHVELPSPVFHPLFMVNMYNILRGCCLFCHRYKINRFQVCKYVAKFRLLEHGLLDAAKALDDLHVNTKKVGEDEDEEDVAAESFVDFEKRVNLFVTIHLARAPPGSGRDNYKDGLVYNARKELIAEFTKAVMVRKCQNLDCGAYGYTFRKEGHTKIIEYDLPKKHKAVHALVGKKRPNVMLLQAKDRATLKGDAPAQDDADISMPFDEDNSNSGSDSEPEGETTFSDHGDDAMDVDHHASNTAELPKTASGRVKTLRGRNERVMAPDECRAHLRRLFHNEEVICSFVFGRHGPFSPLKDGLAHASADMFFLEVLPVSPTRFRPPAKMGETLFEHPQNELLTKVLNTSYRLRDLNADLRAAGEKDSGVDETVKNRIFSQLLETLVQLQIDVNSFMDSSKNPAPMRQGKLPPAGVKQGLEKKEGLFRMHMMGKRVNYAARSVISPDVNIEPNEIGIPPVFARKLTFPEPVTPQNVHEMRELVIRGAREYPGASIVEMEDGTQVFLDKLSPDKRTALANQLLTPQEGKDAAMVKHGLSTRTVAVNKKVYRHLRDGDILILNRQPTLHKPSMMCHKARVLLGEKTIRMHYANCNSYNADFDGDEMNIHFPQNEVARAEAMFIANTNNQYLVPTSGNPLRGLIQDHVVAGVWMTNKDTFFTREEYFQLLYGALRPEDEIDREGKSPTIKTLPPTIWKPRPLWTGKQIISTVLRNITPSNAQGLNLKSKSKVKGELWDKSSKEEKAGQVLFVNGDHLIGTLDKSQFGATDYGLVHSVYELYGADIAGQLLGILSRLFTKFLQHRAFTCRMDDLVLTPTADNARTAKLQENKELGTSSAMDNFPSLKDVPEDEKPTMLRSLLEDVLRDDNKMAGLDMTVKTGLRKLTEAIAESSVPHGLLRKFPHNHMQAMTQSGAKGSPVNAQQISCLLGQQELEGRRVPVMVSGKTLPSFKAFETRAIAGGYIASRFLTGIKPQEFYFHCMAGREGLIDTAVKTSRSGYLQRCLIKHLEGIRVHYDNTVRGSDSAVYQFNYGGDALDVTKQKHLYEFEFCALNEVSLANRYRPRDIFAVVDEKEAIDYMHKVLKKSGEKRKKYLPALSKFSPSRYVGATSERFAEEVDAYIKRNPDKLLDSKGSGEPLWRSRSDPISRKRFKMLMNVKYLKSLVEPGEAVGLLASQGVGEPSTQMTLNTFHFAGHGAANVTLGIPRLREIVMTAARKPKTPSMSLTVAGGVATEDVETFCKKATRLTLSQVVDSVTVTEKLTSREEARFKKFTVDLSFFPKQEYIQEYGVTPQEILSVFAIKFPLILKKEIQVELKRLEADIQSQLTQTGKGKKVRERAGGATNENDGDDEGAKQRDDDQDSEIGDGDAYSAKRKRQGAEQTTYESDESDGEDVMDAEDTIETAYNEMDAPSDDEEDDSDEDIDIKAAALLAAQAEEVGALFEKNYAPTTSFSFRETGCIFEMQFESEMPKLLLVGIIERTCLKTVIREIAGITDCFLVKDEKNKNAAMKLTTNGSNFKGIWEFTSEVEDDMLELNDIYSNDIYATLCTYGVEMARAAILKEVSGVFAVYKIDVNTRHLELIADYMTFDGGYKPFNRSGISTHSSPLLKASYETTAAFLSDATLYGDFDDLTSPSGNIVLGRPNATGTGAFDVVMPLHT